MKDVLIIGQGIAGTAISFELHQRGWDVDVADHVQPVTASKVASGLYNPLVLKRRRVVWKAQEMIEALPTFYQRMEKVTRQTFLNHGNIWEVLPDPGTENDWIALSDNPAFTPYIGEILTTPNERIKAHKVGCVNQTGRVHTESMIEAWSTYLLERKQFIQKRVNPADLISTPSGWLWENREYQHIIWCGGFAAEHPHFGSLPFSPTRGEVMIVHAPLLKLNVILHGNMFIMPLGNDLYKVGATYEWRNLDAGRTPEGLEKLKEAWNKLVDCPFEVVDHQWGIRPNVKDRKALLGSSKHFERSHIFNGMGSRGILMAPWLSKIMADYLIEGSELPRELNINRFSS